PAGRIRREEARLVDRGEHALLPVGREVVLEPHVLRRAGAVRHEAPVRVEHDDVPGTEVETVIAKVTRAGAVAPVVPHATYVAVVVVVIAWRVVRACLVPAPRWVVAGRVGARVRDHGVAQ